MAGHSLKDKMVKGVGWSAADRFSLIELHNFLKY